jgi:hypothetical protein
MTTNLLVNGAIAPTTTYAGVNTHFNAVVEPGAVTLSGRGQVTFDIAPGSTEQGKEYAGGLTVADLLPGTVVRVRIGMTTSGAGATGDFRLTAEGPSEPLPFLADGNESIDARHAGGRGRDGDGHRGEGVGSGAPRLNLKAPSTPIALRRAAEKEPGHGQACAAGQDRPPDEIRSGVLQKVVAWGKLGKSMEWMCAEIGVVINTLKAWAEAHAEFGEALDLAQLHALRWWEDKGQDGLGQRDFNSHVYSRSMAARFPRKWRESKHIEATGADGAPLHDAAELDLEDASPELLRAIAALKVRMKGEPEPPVTH